MEILKTRGWWGVSTLPLQSWRVGPSVSGWGLTTSRPPELGLVNTPTRPCTAILAADFLTVVVFLGVGNLCI